MSQPKTPPTADELPFKDVPIQREPGLRPRARFPTREEVGELPIPTFVTFADVDEKPKWPRPKVEMGMKKSEELALIVQGKNALYGRLEIDHAVKAHGENDVRF